jgi:hypothetical protein
MTSKYKYVSKVKTLWNTKKQYRAVIVNEFRCYYATEREAALAIDLHLISQNKQPINILKPKQ